MLTLSLRTPIRLTLAAIFLPTILPAADWSAAPRVDLSMSVEDNYALAANSGTTRVGLLDLSADLRGQTPTSSVTLRPRLRGLAARGGVLRSAADGFLDLSANRKGQTSDLYLSAQWSDLALLRQYLLDSRISFGLGSEPTTSDVRAIISRGRQRSLGIYPGGSWQVSERLRVNSSMGLLETTYGGSAPGYTDYEYFSGRTGLGYQLSPLAALSVTANAARFEPKGNAQGRNIGLNLQYDKQVSTTNRYYLRLGSERSKHIFTNGTEVSSSGLATGAGISWVWLVNGLFFDATRGVSPNSGGVAVQQTEVRGQFRHLFSQYLTGYVSAHAISYAADAAASSADGAGSAYLTVGAEWRYARRWSLYGGLTRFSGKASSTARRDDSNGVQFGVVYEPQRSGNAASISF
jgi:hypothetical protein